MAAVRQQLLCGWLIRCNLVDKKLTQARLGSLCDVSPCSTSTYQTYRSIALVKFQDYA